MTERKKGYLPTLDGWRAIAILGVMIAHGTHTILGPGGHLENRRLFSITAYGVKGVDLFFAISGFLICSRLLEEYQAHGRISLKGFYIRRFMRILPPYFVFLLTLVVLSVTGLIVISSRELVASFFFLRNYLPDAGTWEWRTGHLWSLAVEEHFYLLWPGLLVLWTPRKAIRRVVYLALAIAVWRVVEFRLQLLQHLIPGVGFFTRSDIRMDALLWGCWFALAVNDLQWRRHIELFLKPAGQVLAAILLAVVLVVSLPFGILWQAILLPLVVIGTVLNPDCLAGRILEWKALRWIGRISYSLYLWQQLFLVPEHGADQVDNIPHLLLNVAAAFGCAYVSYQVIERPMIRLGHRLAPPVTEGRA